MRIFALSLLLAGCLSGLEDDCRDHHDCPAQRPVCLAAGVCVAPPSSDATASVDSGDATVIVADAGADAPMAPDAGADGAPVTDAACVRQAEVCNGFDEDCDGRIDEAAPGLGLQRGCYDFPDHTLRVGECRAGFQECSGGAWGLCTGAVGPAELDDCNGLDDDCDGTADEWVDLFCFDGEPPQIGVGACVGGERTCEAGVASACVGQRPPTGELCDAADNDCDRKKPKETHDEWWGELCDAADNACDGRVDEGVPGGCSCEVGDERPCYAGPAATAGVGLCRAGHQGCTPEARFGACADQVLPEGEVCNGLDDDCDGLVDELAGRPCAVGVGACRRGGQTVCDDAEGLRCSVEPGPPVAERCNDLDDDCDGRADEALHVGEACQVGIGACASPGVVVCDAVGEPRCFGRPGDPIDELCNGADDDCDGAADEGLFARCADFPLEWDGVGVCRAGRRACDGGACEGAVGPGGETCNAVDDDCDGVADEGFEVGAACEVGAGVCLAEAALVCADGEAVCPIDPMPGADEICNGVDDDCDGAIDEGAPPEACYDLPEGVPGVGRCQWGARACGAELCEGQGGPAAEACDGLDDDCDGRIDEGTPAAACYEFPPETEGVGPCRGGTRACGDLVCVGQVGPQAELCNGADDDCDGAIDEGFGVGMVCDAGIGGCARDGVVVCALGEARCNAEPGPARAEECNGADDDCDGRVDEGGLWEACYDFDEGAPGVGRCVAGRRACGDLLCAGQRGPADEVCNGDDDDCDGEVDEVDCECQDGSTRPCYDGGGEPLPPCRAGTQTCVGGHWGPCQGQLLPQGELCDGIDNDCDGAPDDVPGLGAVCEVGAGACAAVGVLVCDPAAQAVVCDVVELAAEALESCNGADDDCDGAVDEGAALCPPGPHAVGVCQGGACLRACEPRWFDEDQNLANGCERGCPQVRQGVVLGGFNNTLAVARDPDGGVAVVKSGAGGLKLDIGADAADVLLADQPADSAQVAWVGGRWVVAARRTGQVFTYSVAPDGDARVLAGRWNNGNASPPGIGAFVGPNLAFVAWAEGANLRGQLFAPHNAGGYAAAQDLTWGGFSAAYWVQFVADPLGGAFVGFDGAGRPTYAQIQANEVVARTSGAVPPVGDEAALPGWRVSAVRDGDVVRMAWATQGGGLRWVRITDDPGGGRGRIFGPIHERAGTFEQPSVTLTDAGPVIYYTDRGVGGDVRAAFLRGADDAYLGDVLVQASAWYVVGVGDHAFWLGPNVTKHVETGCQ